MDTEKVVNGIQECDLNGGLIGNCPYKGILVILEEKEKEIENLRKIIKQSDYAMELIKNKLRDLLKRWYPIDNINTDKL